MDSCGRELGAFEYWYIIKHTTNINLYLQKSKSASRKLKSTASQRMKKHYCLVISSTKDTICPLKYRPVGNILQF